MRILALESTGQAGSVALLQDETIVREATLPPSDRSAKTLAPAIRRLLAEAGWQARGIELIAVATGPGSFTGLRIGVTTAKTLAYAIGAPVIGVNTLQAIATQAPSEIERLSAIVDAQRQQVFAGDFVREASGEFVERGQIRIVEDDAFLAGLSPSTVVSGPGLQKLVDRLPADVNCVPIENWEPRAATIGRLGWRQFQSGRRDDLWRLVPHYFRQSAAEEKLANIAKPDVQP